MPPFFIERQLQADEIALAAVNAEKHGGFDTVACCWARFCNGGLVGVAQLQIDDVTVLAGLVKVAAVNCDEESNKPLCGRMGIKGFPTLKIVRPGSKRGKPVIEDYQGQRSAKAIVDALVDKIPNHVKKVQDSDLEAWLEGGTQAKAILFTEKGTTQPLIKAFTWRLIRRALATAERAAKYSTHIDEYCTNCG